MVEILYYVDLMKKRFSLALVPQMCTLDRAFQCIFN